MQEPFNPYLQWLSIEGSCQPANHYELLGIELHEGDAEAIAHAADVRTAQVRSIRPGAHVVEWQRLLDELNEAKACLLDANAKAAYDAALRGPTVSGPLPPSGPYGAAPQPVDERSQGTGTDPLAAPVQPAGQLPFQPVAGSPPSGASDPTAPYFGTPPLYDWGQSMSQPGQPLQAPIDPYSSLGGQSQTPPGPYSLGGVLPQTPPDPYASTGVPPQTPADAYAFRGMPAQGPPDPYAPTGMPAQAPGQPMPPMAVPVPASAIPMQPTGISVSPGVGGPPAGPEPLGVHGASGEGFAPSQAAPQRAAKPKSPLVQIAVRVLTLLLIVLGAVLATMLYQQRYGSNASESEIAEAEPESPDEGVQEPKPPPSPETSEGETNGEATSQDDPKPGHPPQPGGNADPESPHPQEQGPDPATESPPKESQEPESPANREKGAAFRRALADARFSMAERDLAAARRHLKAAAGSAQGPAERAELARLKTLLGHLDEFWKGIGRAVAGLEGGEELAVANTWIAVVEASQDELIIKAAGRLRRYRIEHLPSPLVMTLINSKLAKDGATKVLIGSFLAVDPDGDPRRARQLWQEAAREGIDVADLMPELDPSAEVPRTSPGKTAPPADQAELEKAEQAVKGRFQAEYDQAISTAGKSSLAKKLLEAGRATNDDLQIRFVMLREARDLAVASGEPALACEAIDGLAKSHTIDVLEMKAAALQEVDKNARGLQSYKEIAQHTLRLIGQAVEAKRLEEAKQLAELAVSSAEKSKSISLFKQARAVTQQLDALARQGGQK